MIRFDEGTHRHIARHTATRVSTQPISDRKEQFRQRWLIMISRICKGVIVLLIFTLSPILAGGEVMLLHKA